MATKSRCPSADCPSLGIDANPLNRYTDVNTGEGEWLIYDEDAESAWIQSNVYYARANCI